MIKAVRTTEHFLLVTSQLNSPKRVESSCMSVNKGVDQNRDHSNNNKCLRITKITSKCDIKMQEEIVREKERKIKILTDFL